jgi:hypothetical protein
MVMRIPRSTRGRFKKAKEASTTNTPGAMSGLIPRMSERLRKRAEIKKSPTQKLACLGEKKLVSGVVFI